MKGVRCELSIREEEVDSLLNFLKLLENGAIEGSTTIEKRTTVQTSMKAGIVLMLYNAVESTVTKSLARLHEIIIAKELAFSNCNESLKKLLVVYYENAKMKSSDIHKQVPFILELNNYLGNNGNFSLTYSDLVKYYTLYSGNLDSKEIMAVLNKYGIIFEERATELQTIKNMRNKLAHGESTFEEVGRDLSIQQLERMQSRTFEYLTNTIEAIEEYLQNEKFIDSVPC